MNKIYLILIGSFLLISASVVGVSKIISQPAVPKQVKVLNGYIRGCDVSDINDALNIYTRSGWVVKTSSYTNNLYYFIILEKY
jgi:hypothetical protein